MPTLSMRAVDKIQRVPPKTRGRLRAFLAFAPALVPLGACAVSQQKEVQMGANSAAQIAQQLPLVRDAESLR